MSTNMERVTLLASLMRKAYPARSEAFCIERAAGCMRDLSVTSLERITASRLCNALAMGLPGGPTEVPLPADLQQRYDAGHLLGIELTDVERVLVREGRES